MVKSEHDLQIGIVFSFMIASEHAAMKYWIDYKP